MDPIFFANKRTPLDEILQTLIDATEEEHELWSDLHYMYPATTRDVKKWAKALVKKQRALSDFKRYRKKTLKEQFGG